MTVTPQVKATPTAPYEGKEAWHGKWKHHGEWHTVCNSSGLPIIYTTPEAACAAAWLKAD